jgi:hypothetical protein
MPLTFPVADNARTALAAEAFARTATEAAERLDAPAVLVSEWLRPTGSDMDGLRPQVEAGAAQGFVQSYEDAKGLPIIAVTFWKLKSAPPAAAPEPILDEAGAEAGAGPSPVEDHTDDLYFRKTGERRQVRRRGMSDINQMDLFGAPPGAGAPSAEAPPSAAGAASGPPHGSAPAATTPARSRRKRHSTQGPDSP